jgi:hypothetical protein
MPNHSGGLEYCPRLAPGIALQGGTEAADGRLPQSSRDGDVTILGRKEEGDEYRSSKLMAGGRVGMAADSRRAGDAGVDTDLGWDAARSMSYLWLLDPEDAGWSSSCTSRMTSCRGGLEAG